MSMKTGEVQLCFKVGCCDVLSNLQRERRKPLLTDVVASQAHQPSL
jgi:hypothetical protein